MKKISLLRELNEMITENDEFNKALHEAELELGIDLGDDENVDNEQDHDDAVELDEDELKRIADYWRKEGADMDDEELADAIGDDLEQLDYTPEEIATGIEKVMTLLGRDEYVNDESSSDDEFSDEEFSDKEIESDDNLKF